MFPYATTSRTAPPTTTLVSAPGLDSDQATMDSFHQELVAIKRQFPGETRMALDASPSTNLQRISTLMDLSRTLVPGDTAVPTMVAWCPAPLSRRTYNWAPDSSRSATGEWVVTKACSGGCFSFAPMESRSRMIR